MMKRYLGLTEEEIIENEQLWQEERDQPELESASGEQMRSIGITPAGLEQDITTGEEMASAELGAAGSAPEGAMPGQSTAGAPLPSGTAPPVPSI